MYATQKREAEQIFTWFSLHNISVAYDVQMITTNSNQLLMNFTNMFSLHFYFHSLMTAVESLLEFLHKLHGEMFIPGSRHKH